MLFQRLFTKACSTKRRRIEKCVVCYSSSREGRTLILLNPITTVAGCLRQLKSLKVSTHVGNGDLFCIYHVQEYIFVYFIKTQPLHGRDIASMKKPSRLVR